MKLGYTILYVNDVRDTLRFYQDVFDLETGFVDDTGDYGELKTGTTTLAFSSFQLLKDLRKNPAHPNPTSPCFEIAFITSDVKMVLSRAVAAGGKLVQNAEEMPWGQTTAYFTDPNGFLVEICTEIGG